MGKLLDVASKDAQQQMFNELAGRYILPKFEADENSSNELDEKSDQYKIEDHKVFKLNDHQLDIIVEKFMQL